MRRARSLSDHANDQVRPRGSTYTDEGDKDGSDSVQGIVRVARWSRKQERWFRDTDDSEERRDPDGRFEPSVRFSEQDPSKETCTGWPRSAPRTLCQEGEL